MSLCQICEKRRPKRFCPGIREDICPRCCGEEREVSVDCPFDCEFLQEARRHEKPRQPDPDQIPNLEIRITDQFLREQEALLVHMSRVALQAALEANAVDSDIREALSSMIRTYRTLDSGLIYETRPSNPYAGAIQQRILAGVEEFRRDAAERTGIAATRDKDVLGVLVFLQRVELHHHNGRSRSRAFLNFLHSNFAPPEPPGDHLSPIVTV